MPVPVSLTDIRTCSPVLQRRVAAGERLVDDHVGRLDAQRAALRHRVAGVDREVHQDLLDLVRIGLDRPQVRAGHRQQLDVLADQAAQHAVQVQRQLAEVDDPRLDDLLAGEGEQTVREVRGALRRLADLPQLRLQRMRGAEPGVDQIRVAEDHRQHVVDVVRDAAGQAADALELLHLRQLLFQPAPLRHVLLRLRQRRPQLGGPLGDAILELVARGAQRRLDRAAARRSPATAPRCARRRSPAARARAPGRGGRGSGTAGRPGRGSPRRPGRRTTTSPRTAARRATTAWRRAGCGCRRCWWR